MSVPFIKGHQIDLHPLLDKDLEGAYWSWFNDADVTRYMIKGATPNTPFLQKQYFNNVVGDVSNNLVLAIIFKENSEHIGNVGLHHINQIHRNAEMGVILGEKAYWGMGIATEAITLICKHGFEHLNLHRIELGVFEEHIGGIKCYEKIGFRREGLKREHVYKYGAYRNVVTMGLLREDLKN
ncbi:GNAT family N-acetyltransferase [Paenibacillus frigoriresistens]|uniref:GNAT family N-acetyltransferase n=1 Tax=Paenibacillus alginolyticus TaxID=59839 RepID=UPI0015667282|nr:GNAT family protein [Paenibacillus frigoriresistens]NRF93658.1 GNAT family N-acetyltransferase [Paenibacillus frigoriresistens]